MYPSDLKYTKDHEWVRVAGDEVEIGITDFAQKQLGDVVFVEVPAVGASLMKGQAFGTIESVKAVSELFAPVSGEVVAVNDWLTTTPERINADPHASWMVRVRVSSPTELASLLDAERYGAFVAG
jgi:glycine cleavage system H protein